MGTRGLYGFRKNGKDLLTYNHLDSYPEGLGYKMGVFCRNTSLEECDKIYERLIPVEDECTVPLETRRYYAKHGFLTEPEKDITWYDLLQDFQGDLGAYKNSYLRHFIKDNHFIKDSLFCEHAYIINLDTNQLEYWIGSQQRPTWDNRYGNTANEHGYYPCRMVTAFDYNSIWLDAVELMKQCAEDIWEADEALGDPLDSSNSWDFKEIVQALLGG